MSKLLRVAVIALCLAPLVQAQENRELSVEELAAGSDAVVIGKCTSLQSMWSDPQHLVTLATISVTETLKGASAGDITVVLPGGVDANRRFPIAMTYPGAPQIGAGEEVFLFLMNDSELAEGRSVAGFSEGKFSIVQDEAGQQYVSRDNIRKVNVTTANGLPRGTRQLTTLSEFKEKVNAALNAKQAEGAQR